MAVTLHEGKRYKIGKHPFLSGEYCSIYVVGITDEKVQLFQRFCEENQDVFKSVYISLKSIGHKTGAEEGFFHFGQCANDDNVCYLNDTRPKFLRIYCVRISEKILIVGGGGAKHVRAWQENKKLEDEVSWMIQISSDIKNAISKGRIKISRDGFNLEGELKFNYEEK